MSGTWWRGGSRRGASGPPKGKGGLILSEKSGRAAEENDNIEQHIDRAIELISSVTGSALGLSYRRAN